MNTINVENCKTLLIGRRGENEVTTVAFDFTEWASEFGSGVVDLYVKRFGDNSAYPVLLTIDGTVASWLVTETDTNVAGYGKAEYVYRVDGKIAKSAVFPFFVAEDIGQPASEPPDPYESWLEQLTALGAETEAHAQAAEQSAEDAAESAQEAAESAASVEGAAEQAEAARDAAQAAQVASETARNAAQTAQASAEASATAASGSAASAAGSATAAAGSASDASASASTAGASATTASNAATAAQTAQSAAEDAAEDAQQAAQQAHVEYEQLSGKVDDLSEEVSQQKSAIEDLTDLTNRKAGMLVDSASGAIASFVPDSTIDNLLGVSVDIEPVQDLHGYDSPWPAGGGKNLFAPIPTTTNAGITFAQDGDYITINGTATANAYVTMFNGVLPAGTYAINGMTGASNASWRIGIKIGSAAYMYISATGGTFSSDGETNILINLFAYPAYGEFSNVKVQYQLEKGSVSTAWTPYSNICPISGWNAVEVNHSGADTSDPTTYTIALGQTVYGGALYVTEDGTVGSKTIVKEVYDGSDDERWVLIADGTTSRRFRMVTTGFASLFASSTFKKTLDTSNVWGTCVLASSYITLNDKDSSIADVSALRTWLAENKPEFAYVLSTPITITLDPVTISTISGQTNNVWADAGDVEVEYAADLKTYIDSKIAAAVAALS